MIILASPQHPIKASRIKYYDDPIFRAMVARQEGKPFPYPLQVDGAGPWGMGDGDEDTEPSEPPKTSGDAALDRQGSFIDELLGE